METKELITNLKGRRMLPARKETLSDKILTTESCGEEPYIIVKNVKEFIRELKKMIAFEVQPLLIPHSISARLNSQINKLAGGKLILNHSPYYSGIHSSKKY